MSDSYTSELREIIDRAFTGEHGGRATAQMIHTSVLRSLPDHLTDYLIGKGLKAQVGSYFREQDSDGVPKRPAVNDDGLHSDLLFLPLNEFCYVHRSYLDRADANFRQAEKIRQRCLSQLGVDLTTISGALDPVSTPEVSA